MDIDARTPAPEPLDPQLAYTVPDVARYLKASDKTVYALVRSGRLRATRLGLLRGVRVMGSAVYELMQGDGARE